MEIVRSHGLMVLTMLASILLAKNTERANSSGVMDQFIEAIFTKILCMGLEP